MFVPLSWGRSQPPHGAAQIYPWLFSSPSRLSSPQLPESGPHIPGTRVWMWPKDRIPFPPPSRGCPTHGNTLPLLHSTLPPAFPHPKIALRWLNLAGLGPSYLLSQHNRLHQLSDWFSLWCTVLYGTWWQHWADACGLCRPKTGGGGRIALWFLHWKKAIVRKD